MTEIQARKIGEQTEKEKDKMKLIEEFEKFNEEKNREKELYRIKVRDYKAQLDVQKAIKMDSRMNERVPVRNERSMEMAVEHSIDAPNVGYFSNYGRYIRNTPQKLTFNPITGVLKENPAKKNIFDNGSETSWAGSQHKSYHYGIDEKNKNLIGYGNIIINNK